MRQTSISVEDNILHYIYFNKHCSVKELEKQIIFSPLTKKDTVKHSILVLEKENLISKHSGNIEITDNGKIVVENFNSYEDYKKINRI